MSNTSITEIFSLMDKKIIFNEKDFYKTVTVVNVFNEQEDLTKSRFHGFFFINKFFIYSYTCLR
ncbi:MAG: hypothetical protein ACK5LT_11590 [Lachnospirales bacterium]